MGNRRPFCGESIRIPTRGRMNVSPSQHQRQKRQNASLSQHQRLPMMKKKNDDYISVTTSLRPIK